jgi:hypothetical protein
MSRDNSQRETDRRANGGSDREDNGRLSRVPMSNGESKCDRYRDRLKL